MAEVFIASTIGAEGFSRRVAIKRVLPGYSENPQFAQMFVSEAQISSRMQHPNIVSVLDFDRDAEGRLFLVMELVEGKDLDAILSTGLLPFPVVIFVLTEMLRGLGYAHDLPAGNDDMRGIVHRDVSPHNVLLSWEGAVKVSDFGIAKARAASEATASVFIKGKPAYMSPEQANGEPLDGRSDLFAVGVMLWEMLVGRRLFVGGDTRSLLAQVLFSPIPRPRQQRADVPKDLDRICMKMLERELPARYGSGEEIIEDLLRCEDAPKGGREELVALLAQRFEPEFPKRQSRRLTGRALSAGEVAPPTPVPFYPAAPFGQSSGSGPIQPSPTMMGHGAGPASYAGSPSQGSVPGVPATDDWAARSAGGFSGPAGYSAAPAGTPGFAAAPGSVDQLMAAHTRTLAPPRPPRRTAMVIGGTVGALAVFALVLVALLSQGGSKQAGSLDAAAVVSTTPADAGAIDASQGVGAMAATIGPESIDAELSNRQVADAPPTPEVSPADGSDAASKAEPKVTSHRGRARITFSTDPPMDVFIDGRKKGVTPRTLVLDAGTHKIRFVNPETGVEDRFSIDVEADKPKTVERRYP